jgi:hypothetical protein
MQQVCGYRDKTLYGSLEEILDEKVPFCAVFRLPLPYKDKTRLCHILA